MKQLSKFQSLIYHFYPGVLITLGFITITPVVIRYGYPPQFSMMLCIVFIAIPVLIIHLIKAKKQENLTSIIALNKFTTHLQAWKLILIAIVLVLISFIIWGITQPLDKLITIKLFGWLPGWYTVQNFSGYASEKIKITLIANLVLNGLVAPVVEEFYFRGYLLPRMQAWGKYAFIVNAVCFSLYHLWQPYVYLTLIIALLPMIYMVSKTRDLRLGIFTHCMLNINGAIVSFLMLLK